MLSTCSWTINKAVNCTDKHYHRTLNIDTHTHIHIYTEEDRQTVSYSLTDQKLKSCRVVNNKIPTFNNS